MYAFEVVNLDAYFSVDVLYFSYPPVQNIYQFPLWFFILTNGLFPNKFLNFQAFCDFLSIFYFWLNFIMFKDHSLNGISSLKFAETCCITHRKSVFVNGPCTLETVCVPQVSDVVLSEHLCDLLTTVLTFPVSLVMVISFPLSSWESCIEIPILEVGLSTSPFNFVNYSVYLWMLFY